MIIAYTLCSAGTFVLPPWKRDADKEYLEGHIEGAIRFDIDKVADMTSPFPHMLPTADQFAEQVGKVRTAQMVIIEFGCAYWSRSLLRDAVTLQSHDSRNLKPPRKL